MVWVFTSNLVFTRCRGQLLILRHACLFVLLCPLISRPSGLQGGLLQMMGPTPPSSTVSMVNSSVGAIGTASIAHRATATVLQQVSVSIVGPSTIVVEDDVLGSVVV